MEGQETKYQQTISRDDRIVTLTEGSETMSFLRNSVRSMRVCVKSLKSRVIRKGYEYNRSGPIDVIRTLVGEGCLINDTIEVIGRSETRSNKFPVQIEVYDPESLDNIRQDLGLDDKQFGKPTVILSYQEESQDLSIEEEWWMSISVSESLFSEIDKSVSSETFEDMNFVIEYNNIFTKNDGSPVEGWGFGISTNFYILKEKGFDWVLGDVKNVFLQNSTRKSNQELSSNSDVNHNDKNHTLDLIKSKYVLERILKKLNYIIFSIIFLIVVTIIS